MNPKKLEHKLNTYLVIVIGIFALLFLRLGMLQVVEAHKYQAQSDENRARRIIVSAPRGEILDLSGEKLAKSKLVYTVSIAYLGLKNQDEVVYRLASLIGDPKITPDYINALIKDRKYRLFEPIIVKRDIPWSVVEALEERRQELPGVNIDIEPMRFYPYQSLAGHLLGYVREISPEELEKYQDRRYRQGDLIGKTGLEKTYEEYLRGEDGFKLVEVNVNGRPIRDLVTIPPIQGNNVVTTINAKLQQTLEKSMDATLQQVQKSYPKAKAGAAVVIDVKTGGILAMTSRPALDPNDFTGLLARDKFNEYYTAKPAGIINRATQGTYPPGSTFKPVTAMAALESGNLDPEHDYVDCKGAYWISPFIKCWGVHGRSDILRALAVSCNTFFQEAGRRAGIDWLDKVAREFGLGRSTGIDLPGEVPGLLPTPDWKKELNARIIANKYEKREKALEEKYKGLLASASSQDEKNKLLKKKEREKKVLEEYRRIDYNFDTTWQPYDTFNLSIGQGSNNYTPLQLANYVATLANGGNHMQPYLVSRIVTPDGKVVKAFQPRVLNQVSVSQENMDIVKQGMLQVAQPGGTAYYLFRDFPPEIKVAAKTGTAQTGRKGDDSSRDYHGVFIAFAPYDNPQIAFAGIIEYGYHGSSSAGVIAKEVFKEYFGIKDRPVVSTSTPSGQQGSTTPAAGTNRTGSQGAGGTVNAGAGSGTQGGNTGETSEDQSGPGSGDNNGDMAPAPPENPGGTLAPE